MNDEDDVTAFTNRLSVKKLKTGNAAQGAIKKLREKKGIICNERLSQNFSFWGNPHDRKISLRVEDQARHREDRGAHRDAFIRRRVQYPCGAAAAGFALFAAFRENGTEIVVFRSA